QPALASTLRRTLWQQLELPRMLRDRGFHALLNLGGFASARTRVPQICAWQNPNIFAAVPIQSRSFQLEAYIRGQRAAQGWSMRRASANVFMTAHSLQDAAAVWPLHRYSPAVIHLGVDTGDKPSSGPREDFALAVGDLYPHKNYEALIDAAAICARELARPV